MTTPEHIGYKEIRRYLVLLFLPAFLLSGCAVPKGSQNPTCRLEPLQAATQAQVLEDIDYLVQMIEDAHPNPFAYISQDEFDNALSKATNACHDDMAIEDFYRHVAWLAGQFRNGHTKVLPPSGWDNYDGKIYPLYWRLDDNKVRLYAGIKLDKRYWGATVLKINGDSALEVLRYYSCLKPREARAYNTDIGRNSHFLWRCMALDYGDTELELELVCPDGQAETVVVEAVPIETVRSKPKKQKKDVKQPSPVEYQYQEKSKAGYMKIHFFRDTDLFHKGMKHAFSDLKDRSAEHLIIDVRGCPGGVTSGATTLLNHLTDTKYRYWSKTMFRYSKLYQRHKGKHAFLVPTGAIRSVRSRHIKPTDNPLRFNGQVIVLIDSRTHSTAVDFAGVVKHNELGVLIGQATGDTMASYGDYLQFRMPNSQLNCMVSCKYYELAGTTQENATQGVKPDYPVVSLLEDGWEHRDRALEFAYELCENGPDDS